MNACLAFTKSHAPQRNMPGYFTLSTTFAGHFAAFLAVFSFAIQRKSKYTLCCMYCVTNALGLALWLNLMLNM